MFSAAHDGDPVVDDHRLVVHAVIEPVELGKVQRLPRGEVAGAPLVRVEHPVLDIRMMGNLEQNGVLAEQEGIVDEHLDLHAPIGGGKKMVQNGGANGVECPKEGLQVNTVGRAVDRAQAPVERIRAVVQQRAPVAAS